jgi:hypothetical protein
MRQMITTTSANEATRTEVLEVKLAFIDPKCAILAPITTTFDLKFSIYTGNDPLTSNGERPAHIKRGTTRSHQTGNDPLTSNGERPLKPSSRQSVLEKTRNRHRSGASWHRRDCPSHSLNCIKVNIADDSGFGT